MLKKTGWVSAGLTVAALSTLVSVSLGAGSAEAAVVYCKTAGVPQGCVVRPVVPVVPVAAVAATGVHATSVRVTRVRVANVGRVGVGARGVASAPARPGIARSGQPRRPPLNGSMIRKKYALGPRPDGRVGFPSGQTRSVCPEIKLITNQERVSRQRRRCQESGGAI